MADKVVLFPTHTCMLADAVLLAGAGGSVQKVIFLSLCVL